MSEIGCVEKIIDGQNCIVCPAIEAVPAVPDQVVRDSMYGWNASAYSIARHGRNCYVEFTLPSVLGVVVGLANARLSNDPRDIPHGFYIYRGNGQNLYRVVEAGVPKTSPEVRDLDWLSEYYFKIERRGNVITYFVDDAHVYTSRVPSHDSLVVVSCLYASDDTVL